MKIWKDRDSVKVKCNYNINVMKKLKSMPDGRWNSELRIWLFPVEKYDELIEIFKDNISIDYGKISMDEKKEILKQFLLRKGYSNKTSKNYVSHLKAFLVYSENKTDSKSINNYLLYMLNEKKCSNSYCNQAVNAIKLFLRVTEIVLEDEIISIEKMRNEQ